MAPGSARAYVRPMDEDTSRAPLGPAIARRAARRWRVHLGLIASFVVSIVVLVPGMPGYGSFAPHEAVGLAFFALLTLHLAQRRRAIRSLVRRASAVRVQLSGDAFLAASALSTLASGIVDWRLGHPFEIPFLASAPVIISFWHRLSVLLLLIALVRHVLHRRRRLRTSRIE